METIRSPVDESAPIRPISYARKYERAERPWRIKSQKIDIRMAFPAWIFGGDSWFMSFYIKPSQLRKKVPIYGLGDQQMSLIHVQDVAGQLIHIAEQGEKSNHYNIYGSELITQEDFAKTVADEIDIETEVLAQMKSKLNMGKQFMKH